MLQVFDFILVIFFSLFYGAILFMSFAVLGPFVYLTQLLEILFGCRLWITKVERFLMTLVLHTTSFLFNGFYKRKIYIWGDKLEELDETSNTIYISNHLCAADMFLLSAINNKIHPFTVGKYLFKNSLQYIPFFGLIISVTDSIPLSRKNKKHDLFSIRKLLQYVINTGKCFSYVLFPEGTRLDKRKKEQIDKNIEFMEKKGLQLTPNVLAPRISGFDVLFKETKNNVTNIIDVTLCYVNKRTNTVENGFLNAFYVLFTNNYDFHACVRVYNKDQINSIESSEEFLFDSFRKKDRFIEMFYKMKNKDLLQWKESYKEILFFPRAYILLSSLGCVLAFSMIQSALGTYNHVAWVFSTTIFGHAVFVYKNFIIYHN